MSSLQEMEEIGEGIALKDGLQRGKLTRANGLYERCMRHTQAP
jgi:hypothetical protein